MHGWQPPITSRRKDFKTSQSIGTFWLHSMTTPTINSTTLSAPLHLPNIANSSDISEELIKSIHTPAVFMNISDDKDGISEEHYNQHFQIQNLQHRMVNSKHLYKQEIPLNAYYKGRHLIKIEIQCLRFFLR